MLGLKCYSGNSSKSWDDCQATSKSCNGTYRCGTFYIKKPNGTEIFTQDCFAGGRFSPCSTDDNLACRRGDVCIIFCCYYDYCNGDSVDTTVGTTVDAAVGTTVGAGSAFHISGILLLTCALASLMILVKA